MGIPTSTDIPSSAHSAIFVSIFEKIDTRIFDIVALEKSKKKD